MRAMTADLVSVSDLACGARRPDGLECKTGGCWRNCWTCSHVMAGARIQARRPPGLDDHDISALVEVEWHDVVHHRYPEFDCDVTRAQIQAEREAAAARLASVPDDGQPRPFVVTTSMVHRADCPVVTGRGTFWRQFLTREEALAAMHRRGGGPIYARCSQCAPDVPEARKVSRQQARIERGEHVKTGLGWPD